MTCEDSFTLSVVVPTHGGRSSVAATAEALLRQPYPWLEVIVVSDGDPAPARAALASITDKRLKLVSQEKRGSASARNLGLSLAQSKWVAFVDDDDVPRDNWLGTWMENARDEHLVLTACVKHWQGTEVLNEKRCCPLTVSDPTMGASQLLAGAFIAQREVLQAIGGYDLGLRASQNQDLGLRILDYIGEKGFSGSVMNTDEIVMDVFTEGAPTRHQRYGTSRAAAAKVFQKRYAERLARDPAHAASLHRIVGRSALEEGDMREFRRSAYAAVRKQPGNIANWKYAAAALIPGLGRVLSAQRRSDQ